MEGWERRELLSFLLSIISTATYDLSWREDWEKSQLEDSDGRHLKSWSVELLVGWVGRVK